MDGIREPDEPSIQHPQFGALMFEDKFDRVESQELTEELGYDWATSSELHAHGNKQADLRNGYLFIQTHADAVSFGHREAHLCFQGWHN